MKSLLKYFLTILSGFVILCFCSTSFAQTSRLWSVEMSFCNNDEKTNEVDLATKIWRDTPICVQFTNVTNKKIALNVELVDGVVTDDKTLRACNAPDRPKTQFANFVKEYDHTVMLQSWETIRKEYIVQYPIWFEWLSHWCIMYNVVGGSKQEWNNFFNIIIRSAKFIDIFVSGTKPIQALEIFQNPDIQRVWADNEYIITLWVVNKGNVDEKVHIVSLLSSLTYQEEFSFDIIIPANTWTIFTTPSFILPVYGWPFRFTSKIAYTPEFNFNIIDGKQPSQIYEGWIKHTQTLLFVRTRPSGIIIAIVVLLIYRTIRKRAIRKKQK